MKKIILLLVLGNFIISCSTNKKPGPEFEKLLAELKDKSLDDIKKEVDENMVMFEKFSKTYDNPMFSHKIEDIAKKDERYAEPFKIDTASIDKALHQFNGITFVQSFKDDKTELEFIFPGRFDQSVELGTGVNEFYVPQKIYYSNGTVKTDSIEHFLVDTHFSREWGAPLPIDSISAKYSVGYITAYDSIVLSRDNPKVDYAGGTIRIEKMEKNYIYLSKSDTIQKVLRYLARNKEGKILDQSASSSGKVSPEKQKEAVKQLAKGFKKLHEKLQDNDFENTDEVLAYLKKNLGKLDFFNDSDNRFHKEIYYYGNVETVTLFFKKDTKTRETSFTAKNATKFGKLINMQVEDGTAFINQKGEEQFRVKGNFKAINARFYEDTKYFYHLNTVAKRMDTIRVFNILRVNKNIVAIQPEQEKDAYTLFDLDNKKVSSRKYDYIYPQPHITLASTDKAYIIDNSGKEILLKGVDRFDNETDGMIRILDKNGIYGFIDAYGKMVVPMKYPVAYKFSEGLAMVGDASGNIGFIDRTGKLKIPISYKRHFGTEEFKDGKIKVDTQDGKTISIDKEGNIL